MRVFDFRIRPPYRGFLDTVMYSQPDRRDRFTRQLGLAPAPSAVERSCELLYREMDECEIEKGLVVGRNSGFLGAVSNADVMSFVQENPKRFLAAASVEFLDRKRTIRQIEDAIAAGFVAINIEPGAQTIPLETDDRKLYPIYALCEDRDVPVIILAGGNAGPDIGFTFPLALDRVLADFPKLNVVAAHGGWPWVHQVLHIAFRRPNLFLSPDMYFVETAGMADYVKAADSWLSDRFIYASSYPLCPVKGYCEWFKALPIRRENLEKIMWRNAMQLLGLND
jgi:predicted TIM-barrel fold metal-dependent hydrolase